MQQRQFKPSTLTQALIVIHGLKPDDIHAGRLSSERIVVYENDHYYRLAVGIPRL